MPEIDVVYEGDLHTRAVHAPSGAELSTDAPKDNEGKGATFSPSDLVATALGSCMATIMGIAARNHGIAMEGTRIHVSKHMAAAPERRIGRLEVTFQLPDAIATDQRALLEEAALGCPVCKSIHPDIDVVVSFNYQ